MISVVMSVNKDRGKLDLTIKSVLNQTFKDFEFIIVNDGGGEELQNKLEEWKLRDDRIRIIVNKENIGLTKALNIGLSYAKYYIIARIDEGDTWVEKKLEYQIKILQKDQSIVLVATGYYDVILENNKVLEKKIIEIPKEDIDFRKSFIVGLNPVIHPSVLFRKNLIYNSTLIRSQSQDYELWLRLSFLGKIYGINEPLIEYVREADSLSHDPYKGCEQFLSYCEIYKNFIKAILNKDFRKGFVNGLMYNVDTSPCNKRKIGWEIVAKQKMHNNIAYKILTKLLTPEITNIRLKHEKNRILLILGKYDEYLQLF